MQLELNSRPPPPDNPMLNQLSHQYANDTTSAQINNIPSKSHVIIIIINKQGQMEQENIQIFLLLWYLCIDCFFITL